MLFRSCSVPVLCTVTLRGLARTTSCWILRVCSTRPRRLLARSWLVSFAATSCRTCCSLTSRTFPNSRTAPKFSYPRHCACLLGLRETPVFWLLLEAGVSLCPVVRRALGGAPCGALWDAPCRGTVLACYFGAPSRAVLLHCRTSGSFSDRLCLAYEILRYICLKSCKILCAK